VVGVDPSEKMLRHAHRKTVPGRIVFVRGSGEALAAKDGSVDLVFFSSVFHHLADPDRTAREAFRVLRSGGFVAMRNNARENIPSYPHHRFFPRFAAIAEAHLPSREVIRTTFASAGFKEIAHEVVVHTVAENWAEFGDQIALKADSLVARLSEAEFETGMKALRTHAAAADAKQPVIEDVELLVFRKP
jgi:ubiquinone/menaquinone biosynthesis C-methylase UbiE